MAEFLPFSIDKNKPVSYDLLGNGNPSRKACNVD